MPQFLGTNPVGWILTAIVLGLLYVIVAILKRPVLLLLDGNQATGVVVGWQGNGTVKAPIVEFTPHAGARVRVTGLVSTPSPSVREGDQVTVLYRASDPQYAQLLLLKEFLSAAVFLGMAGFIVLFWMVAILMAPDEGFGDALGLLARLVDHLHLNPIRVPQYFILTLVIPGCAIATRSLLRDAAEMRAHGIRAVGRVIDFASGVSRLADGTLARGRFPMIQYDDASGVTHTIRRKAAWPLTQLKVGDAADVIYLARRPEKGIVDCWDELYLAPSAFGMFTIAFSGIFVGVLRGLFG
jgi:hypothetical protein